MKRYFSKLNNFNAKDSLQLGLCLILMITLPKFVSIPMILKLVVGLILLFLLFFKSLNRLKLILWMFVLLTLGYEILKNYYLTGNHIFVIFYMCSILVITNIFNENATEVVVFNAKIILCLLLFFGSIQKIISSSFLKGDVLHFMFLQGQLFYPLKSFDVFSNYFNENNNLITTFNENYSKEIQFKELIKNQHIIIFVFCVYTILIEFLLAGIVWIRNEKVKFIFFIFFLIGLLLTRLETGFASILCLLLIIQLPVKNYHYKKYYLTLYSLCLILILFKLGKH